jgi:hypothetical protein
MIDIEAFEKFVGVAIVVSSDLHHRQHEDDDKAHESTQHKADPDHGGTPAPPVPSGLYKPFYVSISSQFGLIF